MKIKIGTLHVEEGEFTEGHTERFYDWRKYRQAAQNVPLFISFNGYIRPEAEDAIAKWPIYVLASSTTNVGFDSPNMRRSYWDEQRTEIYHQALDEYEEWTPDIDFPEPELLVSKRSREWVKKYAKTWDLVYALSVRHEEDFFEKQRLRRKAQALYEKMNERLYSVRSWEKHAELLRKIYPKPNGCDRIQVEVIDRWPRNQEFKVILVTSVNDMYEFRRMEYELSSSCMLRSEQVARCGYCNERYIKEDGTTPIFDNPIFDGDGHDAICFDNETDFCSLICWEDYEMKLEEKVRNAELWW